MHWWIRQFSCWRSAWLCLMSRVEWEKYNLANCKIRFKGLGHAGKLPQTVVLDRECNPKTEIREDQINKWKQTWLLLLQYCAKNWPFLPIVLLILLNFVHPLLYSSFPFLHLHNSWFPQVNLFTPTFFHSISIWGAAGCEADVSKEALKVKAISRKTYSHMWVLWIRQQKQEGRVCGKIWEEPCF